jgi:hypothetical protein
VEYPSLAAACDSVGAALSRRVHESSIRTADTSLTAWRRGPGSRGCVLVWRGTFARTPNMSDEVWRGFLDIGWTPVNHIQADGPDGSSFGMMSRTALCIARTEFDGGDDGDSTYVAEDWWQLVVECDDDLSPARREPG